MKSEQIGKIPRHIAFIMDGNGRWAKKRLLPRKAGHRAGVKVIRKVADACFDAGVEFVTLYAFSTENRSRPRDEIYALFSLMEEYFPKFMSELLENGIRITTIGDISYFPENLRAIIAEAVEKSRGCTRGTLNFALDYGSRDEILRAVNKAIKAGKPLTAGEFESLLDTNGIPDPDLIVRTGGEIRLSNFLLYQSAYSELYFTDILWPDMDKKQIRGILSAYSLRDRRFGKVTQ